jgi:hypothetical protein
LTEMDFLTVSVKMAQTFEATTIRGKRGTFITLMWRSTVVSLPPPLLVFPVGTYPSGRSWVGSRPYPLLIGQTGLAKKKHSSLFGLVDSKE